MSGSDDWMSGVQHRQQRAADDVARMAASLNALSPLNVLERGYSITHRADGTVVRKADRLSIGEVVTTRLHRGQVTSRVESIDE